MVKVRLIIVRITITKRIFYPWYPDIPGRSKKGTMQTSTQTHTPSLGAMTVQVARFAINLMT